MGYVFISYKSEDKPAADKARAILQEENIACWMAPYDIPGGLEYAEVLNDAVENCSCLLLLLTESAQQSQFISRELERAVSYNKTIIPMQLEDCQLTSAFKFYIGSNQIVAVRSLDRDSEGLKKVLKSIRLIVGDDRGQEKKEHNCSDIGDFQDLGDGYITFGSYPQSQKTDYVKIGVLCDYERGYYRGSDGFLYTKAKERYFKVEPIKWRVLERKENSLFVVADKILDTRRFDRSSGNYANSEIRGFLNGEFYDKVFRDAQKNKIVVTAVDNNARGRRTSDRVFLLSNEEVKQYFSSDSARQKEGSDYAKARGLHIHGGTSPWWLRSSYRSLELDSEIYVQGIRSGGNFNSYIVYYNRGGVVPAMWIKP